MGTNRFKQILSICDMVYETNHDYFFIVNALQLKSHSRRCRLFKLDILNPKYNDSYYGFRFQNEFISEKNKNILNRKDFEKLDTLE
ncbi:MAG: hypothetical protein HeimC2_00400 [Candidatus Heimdallarchaeota archaeon LC_2]|nr:MAG: hypothetical protein HeimC2_00400 [Candidatus Heimdallarchaeota archaeon LC_2]